MSAGISGLERWLQPYAAAAATYAAQRGGRLTSTFRSRTEQTALWHNRAHNPYPVAPPGRSYHEYGRAFDITAPPHVLHALGSWWRSLGGTWSPRDEIHFQA